MLLFYNLSETFAADEIYYLGPRLLRYVISYSFIAFSSRKPSHIAAQNEIFITKDG